MDAYVKLIQDAIAQYNAGLITSFECFSKIVSAETVLDVEAIQREHDEALDNR